LLTFEQMKELVELVARHRLSGVEVERSGFRLKIDGFQAMAAPAAQVTTAPRAASPAAADQAGGLAGTVGLAGTGAAAGLAGGLPAGGSGEAAALPLSPLAAAAPLPGLPVHAGEAGARPPGAAGTGGAAQGDHILNSPIVGTFYRSPSPDASPFVDVGSRVRRGQTLCIVEAMKLMNEIESDVDGVISEIYPQNAQAVEFGEPLFAIRVSS